MPIIERLTKKQVMIQALYCAIRDREHMLDRLKGCTDKSDVEERLRCQYLIDRFKEERTKLLQIR
jgi:hypothetical protein